MGISPFKHWDEDFNYSEDKRERIVYKYPPDNPDPFNFKLGRCYSCGGYQVIEVTYPDCSTYEGRKILVCKGLTIKKGLTLRKLDPHFHPDHPNKLIARFEPTELGWELAKELVHILNKKAL